MQYNIFQNDFYEDRPGVPWAYKVTVYAGMLQTPILVLSKGVKEVNLPDLELMTFRVHYGGRAFDIPTRYRNSSTFTMKFSERNDLLAYHALAGIFSRTYDYDNSYSNLSSDLRIKVEILDPQNLTQKDTQLDFDIAAVGKGREETKNMGLKTNDADAVEIYEFKGCFIDKIDDLELDYSSEDIVEWGVTIQFNEVKVTYPHQAKINLADDVDRSESVDVPKKSKDSISFTNPEEMRTEKQLMGTGGGEGGGGKEGTGAGNPDGRPGADGGLSATGNKDVNRHGNSQDGTDLHNDNNGVKGGRSETGEAKENPDKTKEMPQPTESKAIEEADANDQTKNTQQTEGNGTGNGSGGGDEDGTGTGATYEQMRGTFELLLVAGSSKKKAEALGVDQITAWKNARVLYDKYMDGELDETASKAFEEAMENAKEAGVVFDLFTDKNTMGVSY